MKIEIKNLTTAQEVALEDMLSVWEYLGSIGSSRWTAFYADGDGNFRPKITVNGKKPEATKLIEPREERLWKKIKVGTAPTEWNGLRKYDWLDYGEMYMMDFDKIDWKLDD